MCEIFLYWFHVFIRSLIVHENYSNFTLYINLCINEWSERWTSSVAKQDRILCESLDTFSLSLWVHTKVYLALLPYSIFLLFHFYINTHSWMPCANWKFYRSHKTHKSINLTYSKMKFLLIHARTTWNKFSTFSSFLLQWNSTKISSFQTILVGLIIMSTRQ